MNWAPFPLMRIAVVLAIGIAVQETYELSTAWVLCCLFIVSLLWLLAEKYWYNVITKSTVTGFLMLCVTFFLGDLLVHHTNAQFESKSLDTSQPLYVSGTLIESLKSRDKPRFVFQTDYLFHKDTTVIHNAKVLITFSGEDTLAGLLAVGNRLYLKAKFKKTSANTNPESFDYAQFLKYKGIGYSGYVRAYDHHYLSDNGFTFFKSLANRSAVFAEKTIHKYFRTNETIAIAEALLIGKQVNISDEIYQSYVDTGAIHVLSVSGMHVAIFISVFLFLFNSVKNRRLGWKVFKSVSLLSIVWFYVILTGMSPSVVRAGTMVSLYVIGSTFFKRHNTYNILALAAILMLIYDPFYLFQISFQLSFLSLLSILFFQPLISSWWKPKYRLLKMGWMLINVSLAAQIMIFPVAAYIFHQFSLSFALSSLFAVPLVSVIIYGGTVMVLAELVFPYLASTIGISLDYCIAGLNSIIKYISHLPYSVISQIYISGTELMFLSMGVLSLMYWIVTREKSAFYWIMGSVFVVIVSGTYDKMQNYRQSFLTVYDLYANEVVDFCYGKQVIRYMSGDPDDPKITNITGNHMIKRRIQHIDVTRDPLHQIGKDIVFIYTNNEDIRRIRGNISSTYLYVANDKNISPEYILERTNPDTVILSPNLKPWISKKWVALQLNCGFGIIDIKNDGAFLRVY